MSLRTKYIQMSSWPKIQPQTNHTNSENHVTPITTNSLSMTLAWSWGRRRTLMLLLRAVARWLNLTRLRLFQCFPRGNDKHCSPVVVIVVGGRGRRRRQHERPCRSPGPMQVANRENEEYQIAHLRIKARHYRIICD